MEETLMTPEQVADRLQVTRLTVYEWLREGQLRGVKLGKRIWRVRRDDLQAFLSGAGAKPTWQDEFRAILARIESRLPTDLPEEEADQEIAAACQEARELVYAGSR